MTYNWNIPEWIKRQLPGFLNKDKMNAWLKVLLAPIQDLHDDFLATNEDLDFRAKYNSQQKVLAGLLNKLFDPALKRIRVETISLSQNVAYIFQEARQAEGFYIYQESSLQVKHIYQEGVFTGSNGFVVYVPTALAGEETKIKSWVEYYKLANRTFKIVYI